MKFIIYDGDCGFCNRTIMFIAGNDINNHFKFVSNSTSFGNDLLEKFQIQGLEKSTIVLIEKENFHTKSIAIRKILLKISKYQVIGFLLFLIPRILLDILYDFIAKRRKRIIKNKVCNYPSSEIRKKFIT